MTVDQQGRGPADGDDNAWVVEHRLGAVLEVLNGAPVAEVALRYGASRQSIYNWRDRYERDGQSGFDGPVATPAQQPAADTGRGRIAGVRLRRLHPRWGARRLVFELRQRGVQPVPVQATIHRALVRNGLVEPQQQRHKRKYRRWQREAPMHLWQMDLAGGIYLADGRECKMLTGIDDHSRFVVIATPARGAQRSSGVRGVPRGDAPPRRAVRSVDRQRKAIHWTVHPPTSGRGAVRASLP